MRWILAASFVVLAVLAIRGPACAQEPGPAPPLVRLAYTAPEGCPDAASFRLVAGARTRRELFAATAAETLVVTIQRRGRLYQGTAAHLDASGAEVWARPLDPIDDCVDVVQGLAMAIRIHLDPPPSIVEKERPEPDEPARRPEPPAAPPRHPHRVFGIEDSEPVASPSPAPPASLAERPRDVLVRVGGSAALGLGTAPGVAGGITFDVGVRWRFLSVGLEGRGDFPSKGADVGGGKRVSSSRYAAALVPCWHWRALFGCGVLELGVPHATGNANHPRFPTGRTWEGGLRAGVEWPFARHLAARVSGEVLGALQAFTIQLGDVPRWSAPAFSGTMRAGLVASF